MPWKKEDVDSHIGGLTDNEKEKWVSIANSVYNQSLEDKMDEKEAASKAIRIANSKCKTKGKVKKIHTKEETKVETIEYFDTDNNVDNIESNNTDCEKYTPIAKIEIEKQIVTGIVLEPDTVDLQGDIYDSETIEKSAHDFLKDVRRMGLMHKTFGKDLHVVESYVAPVDFELENRKIKKGTWIIAAKVVDGEIWDKIKNQEITGFSIGAVAQYENI